MSFVTRIGSLDDTVMPRRGLFIAPDGFRFVWHVTIGKPRLFLCDYDRTVVEARPMYWIAFFYASPGPKYFARGVTFNPATESGRWNVR